MADYDLTLPDIFYEFKKIPMMKRAVVAGGYLRDQVYKIKPDDLDIFIPITSESRFLDDFNIYWGEFEKLGCSYEKQTFIRQDAIRDEKGYPKKPDLKIQMNIKHDKTGLDIDLMAMRLNVEGFMSNLIEGFPYGNQQIVTDGKKVITSDQFETDITHGYMTLRLIDQPSSLPRLIDKFNKVKAKYPKVMFVTDYTLQKRTGDDWL